jgi:hypothetical protein
MQVGRYACACGEQAYRDLRTGEIRVARRRRPTEPAVSASYADWREENIYGEPFINDETWRDTTPEQKVVRRAVKRGKVFTRDS